MKSKVKQLLTVLLVRRVKRLMKKSNVIVIAVAGSIGKTSTKHAVAQLLSVKYRVQFQEGNYNVPLTVPLVFFGLPLPSLLNPFAWLATFIKISWLLRKPYPYDIVVVELGTDGPGQLQEFAPWLRADIGVLTAIAPEHMDNFRTISAVAREELVISDICESLLINRELIDKVYFPQRQQLLTYALQDPDAHYLMAGAERTSSGYKAQLKHAGAPLISLSHPSISKAQLYSITAALAVGDMLGMTPPELEAGVAAIAPIPGRMQLLAGLNDSIIIDETYNSSPEATKGALKTLYDMPGSQKIALLGSMNELGDLSPSAHAEIGAACDPNQLQLVVTLGKDAKAFMAPAAQKRGCNVVTCDTPYEAAEHIRPLLKPSTVLLAKGSQNGVFAEEAVKQLLANPQDATKLVRQTPFWLKLKQRAFQKH